ncbi:MAG: hypothetical protein IPI72_11815 [Flavobacteriales bacterium]|nr:hypothetical protein [Flavobacteriales bacterium]
MNLEQVDALLYLALGDIGNGWVASTGHHGRERPGSSASFINTRIPHSPWKCHREGKGDFAYLGCMEEGILVLDVGDPSNITFLSELLASGTDVARCCELRFQCAGNGF